MTDPIIWGGTPGPWQLSFDGEGKHTIRMGEAITSPHCFDAHLMVEYDHGSSLEEAADYPAAMQQYVEACKNAHAFNATPRTMALLRLIADPARFPDEIAIVEEAQAILAYVDSAPEAEASMPCPCCNEWFDPGELEDGLCSMCSDEHGG